jgi:hypothetical protein
VGLVLILHYVLLLLLLWLFGFLAHSDFRGHICKLLHLPILLLLLRLGCSGLDFLFGLFDLLHVLFCEVFGVRDGRVSCKDASHLRTVFVAFAVH